LADLTSEIVSSGPDDDLPTSGVIDVVLTHLIESETNVEQAKSNMNQRLYNSLKHLYSDFNA